MSSNTAETGARFTKGTSTELSHNALWEQLYFSITTTAMQEK